MVEDFVILGVIFGSRKERRNVVVQFSGVRGCRKGGKGMGEVFTEFRGGAWTQESRVVALLHISLGSMIMFKANYN